jgi:hypothetical protein
MTQNNFIHQFVIDFFTEQECHVDGSVPGTLQIDLTTEMDKVLMNRPFYWRYMESTGQIGQPMQLTLITDPGQKDQKGEWIHFGTPRLEQIEQYLEKEAYCTLLYEVKDVSKRTMLHPWLVTNYCVMYEGKQKKEEIISLGLNLINGIMVFRMMEQLEQRQMAPVISDQCYTVSPLITLGSGYKRIENYIDNYIQKQSHDWAKESYQLLQEELTMIDYFYRDVDDETERTKAVADVTKRLAPKITHHVLNGGLFYLSESFLAVE